MVTFCYSKLRGGFYGVYVKCISKEAITLLAPKLPELTSKQLELKDGAVRLFSDRLHRYDNEKQAIKNVKRLNSLDDKRAVKLIWHLYLKVIHNKDFVIGKFQYNQVHTDLLGKTNMQFTTQDKQRAETTVIKYVEQGTTAKLKKTVNRSLKLTKEQYKRMQEIGEESAAIPEGLKGFSLPVKSQNHDRKLQQKKKRTTSVSFWKRK